MNYGCKKQKKDIRDYKIVLPKEEIKNLPETFELKNLPRVKNQGIVSSCVAHAASSILEYYTNNTVKLSTDFIYGAERFISGESAPGMYLVNACKIISKYGDMLEEDCSGNHEVPRCSEKVEFLLQDKNALKRAEYFKIRSYYSCSKIEDIKYAIFTYGPVLGSLIWYKDYSFNKRDKTICFNLKSKQVPHAVVIYGWNEKGFLIQNSWGKNFGNNGRCIIPYEYAFKEARVLIDLDNTEEIQNLVVPKCNHFKILCKIINFILNLKMLK